ncbi:MAG: tyrosine-type recombinase/integrase [Nocardioidaceae bacterium]
MYEIGMQHLGAMQRVVVGEPEVHRQRGKWVVRQRGYDPATGRRRVKQLGTFATKRDAMAHRKSVATGRVGSDDETLAEFLDESWLPSKEERVEPSTLDQYRWAVRLHIVPLLGAVRLRDLSPEVVDVWVADLVAPAVAEGKPRLGATSARLVRKVLSMALQEAVERGRLPRNPVVLTQPPRRDRSFRKQSWTLDEARRFLAGVREHRLQAAFHLGLVTGLRRGELLGLRWVDVDLDRCQLAVAQQLSVERGRPSLKQLKTETSERVVTFGPGTAGVLSAHQDRQEAEAAFAGDAWQASGLVFTTPLGGWIDPNNFSRTMDALVDQVGVPRITPRGLRHTAHSVGRVVVGDDKVMQERLGHADIGITLGTYTQVVTDQHRAAGERLDEVFGGQ